MDSLGNASNVTTFVTIISIPLLNAALSFYTARLPGYKLEAVKALLRESHELLAKMIEAGKHGRNLTFFTPEIRRHIGELEATHMGLEADVTRLDLQYSEEGLRGRVLWNSTLARETRATYVEAGRNKKDIQRTSNQHAEYRKSQPQYAFERGRRGTYPEAF